MDKRATAVACLLLAGCSFLPQKDPSIERDIAQRALDNLVPACRDGVQYLISPVDGSTSKWGLPRMKPDGSLYRCGIKRSAGDITESWEQ